ncbi:MAG: ABC transporter substrate-binding protein [Nitrospinota bacterium]
MTKPVKGIFILFALALFVGSGPSPGVAEAFQFELNWVPNATQMGVHVAQGTGLYKAQGLDVKVTRGFGTGRSIKDQISGLSDAGMGDFPAVINSRAKGSDLKALGVIFGRSPYAIFSLASANVKTPKDLKGLTLGSPATNAARMFFPALALKNGLDPQSVKWQGMTPSATVPSLFSGKVDAIAMFVLSRGFVAKVAKKSGKKFSMMPYNKFGIDGYGITFITSERKLAEKKGSIRKFVRASQKGYEIALGSDKTALGAFQKLYPEIPLKQTAGMWKGMKGFLLTPEAKTHGLLYMDRNKAKMTRDMTVKYFKIPDVPLKDLYTNEFLETK